MRTMSNTDITGYLRPDGGKGIRNHILVVYTVECAHHVATEIANPYRHESVQVVGFGGCYPSDYAENILARLCTHPNTAAVLIVSLGCEGFKKQKLNEIVRSSGRPVASIIIQEAGGTRLSIASGKQWIEKHLEIISRIPKVRFEWQELIIGAVCGGSDATTGIAGNPSVGKFFDSYVAEGGIAIFEETGEMIGLEDVIANRGTTPSLSADLRNTIIKAARYYSLMGHGSFSPGNADGGLTTIEEKSLSSYSKSGTAKISGILKPGDKPATPGLYLLDVVPDGPPKFGYPNINDNAEIAELISCGCHMILFISGRGSVVGSAVSPVIKITGNPLTFEKMREDMDVNAGKVLNGDTTLEQTAAVIRDKVVAVANGALSASEALGHQEFVLTYKTIEKRGSFCGM